MFLNGPLHPSKSVLLSWVWPNVCTFMALAVVMVISLTPACARWHHLREWEAQERSCHVSSSHYNQSWSVSKFFFIHCMFSLMVSMASCTTLIWEPCAPRELKKFWAWMRRVGNNNLVQKHELKCNFFTLLKLWGSFFGWTDLHEMCFCGKLTGCGHDDALNGKGSDTKPYMKKMEKEKH